MSSCKDVKGNTLEVGHQVVVLPRTDLLWIAKVVEVSDGGLTHIIDKNNKGMTPAKVRIIIDITMQADSRMPIFVPLCRIVSPESDSLLDKLMGEPNSTPPRGPVSIS